MADELTQQIPLSQMPSLPQEDMGSLDPTAGVTNIPGDPTVKKKLQPKMILFAAAGFLVLFALILVLSGGRRQQAPAQAVPSSAPTDVSRYADDPDEDRVPSFIEQKLTGFDPAISELDHCFNTKCDSVNTEAIKRIPRNVIILLDTSGSMKQKVGDQTKMDSAKLAITEYLKKASQLEMTKVGLIVYGHKGSNSQADKTESCASAESKAALGELKLETAPSILGGIQPVGWTPIGVGLREALTSFQAPVPSPSISSKSSPEPTPGKVINEVVIISDGIETCDSNPVQAAKELFESADNVIVHVIGFAVDGTADNKSLREISQAAGGTYATAPTIDELKLAMDLQWDNYVRRAREDACRAKGYATFQACKDGKLSLVRAYVSSELSRPPKELSYDEKIKIDRMRHVFPAYINGTLDPYLVQSPDASISALISPTPSPTSSPVN